MSKTAHDYASKDRTSDVLNVENVNIDFASLLLSGDVLKGLSLAGFERPSPIQLKAIPIGRCGLDLIVQAKAGTGKTCVFSVIILESLDLQCGNVQALVLTPTREIATQVQGVIQAIGGCLQGLRCHTFIGGTLFGPDRQKLKKCHVAVGTPGRVKQLIEYDAMPTDGIRLFVLDEADKLLDEKFQDQINWIYNRLPVSKQMLALSATYPEALAKSLTTYMRDPTFVRLNPRNLALKGIKQFYKVVPGHGLYHKAFEIKVNHLLQLLTQMSFSQCLVFSNLSSRAQNLSDILCENGWPSTCISGNQDQTHRLNAMSMLKTFQCRVLISTDLTARGIDAENVNLIVNLDVPSDGKTYLHRIGRAGRFGSKGVAVTLASEGNEESLLRNIQRQCRVKLRVLPDPVPSDLVNSIDVNVNELDVTANSGSSVTCDGNDTANISDDNKFEETDESQSEFNNYEHSKTLEKAPSRERAREDFGEISLNGPAGNIGKSPESNFAVEPPLKSHGTTSLTFTMSGINNHSIPFNIRSPINFKIPSLAEKVGRRSQQDTWTWQKATADFEQFMSGCRECCDVTSHLQEDGFGEWYRSAGLVQTVVGSSDLAGDVVIPSQSEEPGSDNSGTNQMKKDSLLSFNAETLSQEGVNPKSLRSITSSHYATTDDKGGNENDVGVTSKGTVTNVRSVGRGYVNGGTADVTLVGTSNMGNGFDVHCNELGDEVLAGTSSLYNAVTEGEKIYHSYRTASESKDDVDIVQQENDKRLKPFGLSTATSKTKDDGDTPFQEKEEMTKRISSDFRVADSPSMASSINENDFKRAYEEDDRINAVRVPITHSFVNSVGRNDVSDRAESAVSVAVQEGDRCKKSDQVSMKTETSEMKEKVCFSWRPSQDFHSSLVPENTDGFSAANHSNSSECDDTTEEPLVVDGIRKKMHSAPMHQTSTSLPEQNVVSNHIPETVSVRPWHIRQSNQTEAVRSKHCVDKAAPSQKTFSPLPAAKRSISRKSQGSGCKPTWTKPSRVTSNAPGRTKTSKNPLQTDYVDSSAKTCPGESNLGADPIWQAYTQYLKPESVGIDSDVGSTDSGSDDVSSAESQDSPDDDLPSEGSGDNKPKQTRHPDYRYDSATAHCWWLPNPYELQSSASYYGVPDYTPFTTPTQVDHHNQYIPPRFHQEDYYNGAYNGMYNTQPHHYNY
ncbi:uncharacterized protein [Asterias amurensis]|uniref:uncharacterized protein n=1 Tax=Asterias amurensis TaxID=7602 RepID=UPI003AB87971